MKVAVGFPLSSDGPLGRASAVAAGHPSYRVEGVNGSARVSVELALPVSWQLLDAFSGLLRGEGRAEYVANGTAIGPVFLAGIRGPVGDALTLGGELRYQRAEGDTNAAETGLLADKIDLGGWAANFAIHFRF